MITKITGTINRVLEEEIRVQVGPVERQVLVSDFVRRQLQMKIGEEVTLHTSEYLEGNQMSNRMIPRMIGFLSEGDQEFFDLFCTVEKIGVRKAMRAMARPVHEIASAIHRSDKKWLATLPGIGAQTAEQVVATLQKKVARFTLAPTTGEDGQPRPTAVVNGGLFEDLYNALLSLGHNPGDARNKIDNLIGTGQTFRSLEEALVAIYSMKA
jgi:Holliday junction DNA helicase RuvA